MYSKCKCVYVLAGYLMKHHRRCLRAYAVAGQEANKCLTDLERSNTIKRLMDARLLSNLKELAAC